MSGISYLETDDLETDVFYIWKQMSLGFTCPKSGGNIGTWYQGSVNKCQDAKVWETLVLVTGVTHPTFTNKFITCPKVRQIQDVGQLK